MGTAMLLVVALALLSPAGPAAVADKGACEPVKVLFVVGGTTHDGDKLPAMLKDALEATGQFEVRVTKDRDEYRWESVSRYDAVMVYTTRGDVTPEQEQGLLRFVRDGGGLVSIHGSTSSFPSSDAWKKMFGGRFTKHGRDTFTVKVTAKRHCTMREMAPFEINEETYEHDFHPDADLIVLMRRDTDGEPVTWIQYYGQGRVFATALGHDTKTFERPEFQSLIDQGLLWSAGRMGP